MRDFFINQPYGLIILAVSFFGFDRHHRATILA